MTGDIFMTGGAGFLGRAILARYAKEWPDCRFTVYSRDEAKHARTRALFPQHRYIMGDVRDAERLELAMAGHRIVIHAAAMKYVPQAEMNVSEAVTINVNGSRNICSAAIRHGVEQVIGVSTDKACNPNNVYGTTKFLMERLFQEASTMNEGTRFNLVRYGNVIASTGSVIPLFRRQAREGRVTLTNPDMTRFWITVDEAVDLILLALQEKQGGTVLIPRLASLSIREVALAAAAIELGERGANGVTYDVVGQRFGEKVHEELLSPIEMVYSELTHTILKHKLPQGEVNQWVVMRMWPVTQGIRKDHIEFPYTSDKADKQMTVGEFKHLIQASPE